MLGCLSVGSTHRIPGLFDGPVSARAVKGLLRPAGSKRPSNAAAEAFALGASTKMTLKAC
jgi:hypothetical protein